VREPITVGRRSDFKIVALRAIVIRGSFLGNLGERFGPAGDPAIPGIGTAIVAGMRRVRHKLQNTSSSAAASATLRIRKAAHPTVSTTSGTQIRLLSANIYQRHGHGPRALPRPRGVRYLRRPWELVRNRKLSSLTFANPMRIIVNCTKQEDVHEVSTPDGQEDRLGLDCTVLCFMADLSENLRQNVSRPLLN